MFLFLLPSAQKTLNAWHIARFIVVFPLLSGSCILQAIPGYADTSFFNGNEAQTTNTCVTKVT